MIFVVVHTEDGEEKITVEYGDELTTDIYKDIQKIFFCDNEDEAEMVIHEIKRWGMP